MPPPPPPPMKPCKRSNWLKDLDIRESVDSLCRDGANTQYMQYYIPMYPLASFPGSPFDEK